ncbi:MAG: alginate export family protein [Acidobacteriota bacterium]
MPFKLSRSFPPRALAVAALLAPALVLAESPPSLDELTPDWLELSVVQRTRFEVLDGQFRVGRTDDDSLLLLRTLVHPRFRLGKRATLGIELQDSRVFFEREQTPLGTSLVNAVEPLRAYLQLRGKARDGSWTVDAGRITLDVGSRRFVARNRYRNTINSFTGVDARWQREQNLLRAFFLLPHQRRPTELDALRRNGVRVDEETSDVRFAGLFASGALSPRDRWEAFLFRLEESDSPRRATRNRRLTTPGFRLLRTPLAKSWDYVVEVGVQTGTSRESRLSDEELDHRAYFVHGEVGHTFDAAWSPRLALQFDVASGDEDPNDLSKERFDTLYGARRFDFGPTGIYGPFSRSNLVSPGLRLQLKPGPGMTGFVAYRIFELESATDVWGPASLRDTSGQSGRSLGSQLEARWRKSLQSDWLPGKLGLEFGALRRWGGTFQEGVLDADQPVDSNYGYVQTTWSF